MVDDYLSVYPSVWFLSWRKGKWIFVFFVSFPIFSSAHLFNFFQMGYLLSLLFYLFALGEIKDKKTENLQEKNTGAMFYLPYWLYFPVRLYFH